MCTDYTFCIKQCDNTDCKRNKLHLKDLDANALGQISWSDFSECEQSIQYFRENLDWFHSIGVDMDKLKTVLALAERAVKKK